jgi:hypothetical protein
MRGDLRRTARALLGASGAAVLLTACPPTDDYRIRETPSAGGSVSSGGDGGSGALAAGTAGKASRRLQRGPHLRSHLPGRLGPDQRAPRRLLAA